MTNADRTKIITATKALLYARRSGNVKREQAAFDKLRNICSDLNVDMEQAINQVTAHLRKTSIAASMNGIV